MDTPRGITAGFSDTAKAADSSAQAHLRCLTKAMDRIQCLLTQDEALQDYDQIHAAKSILYAAIEQMGTRVERMGTVQRMLRELFAIVTSQYQTPGHDKQVGLQILAELKDRYSILIQ